MDDRQRLRYSRHLLLNEFGEEAQERLLSSHALVIGAAERARALAFLRTLGLSQRQARGLTVLDPPPTIGAFHDCLRQLHADGSIYLHPWTGPLYALPEPAYALLVGHGVAYYASAVHDVA